MDTRCEITERGVDKLGGLPVGDLPAAGGVRLRDGILLAYGRSFEHPAKIRFVRWLIRRIAAGRVLVRYAAGAVVAIDPDDYVGWAIFKTGYYEAASLRLALRIMAGEPGLFVDVGANFGWYSCAVARVAGCSVISVEPDCENCALLRRNVALGGLRNIVVFNGAVGERIGVVPMIKRALGNSGTVAIATDDREAGEPVGWAATIPLEALLKRLVSSPTRPVLIKIDVEGFERRVLDGLDFAGPFRPKNILMEVDPQLAARVWKSFDDLQGFFATRGYVVLDVLGRPVRDPGAIPEANIWARERTAHGVGGA